jgi:hypothetical protein
MMEVLGAIDDRQSKIKISIQELVTCELYRPDIQRLIDYERVAQIIHYQKAYYSKHSTLFFISDIIIAELESAFYVIDGLHRVEAIKSLYTMMPDYMICLNVISCRNKEEMIDTFICINKSEPVPEHVIMNATNTPKIVILEEFRKLFRRQFRMFISDSQSPHRPHVNEHNMMYHLNKSGIEQKLSNGSLIYKYMLYVNNKYLKHLDSKNTDKCNDKAAKFNASITLYITNDKEYNWLTNKSWIDEYLESSKGEHLTNDISFVQMTRGKRPWHTLYNASSNMSIDVAGAEATSAEATFVPCLHFEGARSNYEFKHGDHGLGYYKIISSWNLPSNTGRKTIPKQIRGTVWRNYFNTLDGSCPLCSNSISIDDFECGHIISVKNGGSNYHDNLKPICGKCNKSMSSTNMDDYCKQYGIAMKN